MNLEHDLRQALKRKEPPPGFSERVLNKIARSEVGVSPTPASWRRFALPVVASLMLVAGGSFAVQRLEFGMPFARLKPSPTDVTASRTEAMPRPADVAATPANVTPSPADAARLKPSSTDVTASARDQNARAAHDVVLALQIASEKVSAAQSKFQEMTHHEHQNNY